MWRSTSDGTRLPERRRFDGQLLRYCDIDTLATVMVYVALRGWVK